MDIIIDLTKLRLISYGVACVIAFDRSRRVFGVLRTDSWTEGQIGDATRLCIVVVLPETRQGGWTTDITRFIVIDIGGMQV